MLPKKQAPIAARFKVADDAISSLNRFGAKKTVLD
jgi:hypothetical protein